MAGEPKTTHKAMMNGVFAAIRSEKLRRKPDPKLIDELEKAAFSTNPKRALAEIAARQFLAVKPHALALPTVAHVYAQYQADTLGLDRDARKERWAADHQRLEAGKEQFGRWHSVVREELIDEANTLAILGIHNRYFEDLSGHLEAVIHAYRALKIPWLPIIHRRSPDVPSEDVLDFVAKEHAILETASIRAGGRSAPAKAAQSAPPPPEDDWGPNRGGMSEW